MNNQKLTRERQKLMISMLEKKIRLRARRLYEERGRVEGRALEDWLKAEAEILKSSILRPLWTLRDQLRAEA
ncbi:MAG TPA: DUF2934 domain-containing protein [Terriglobales bacterium]|nr:DUF2934 domain-containing protein [Terriglobales bacterium]